MVRLQVSARERKKLIDLITIFLFSKFLFFPPAFFFVCLCVFVLKTCAFEIIFPQEVSVVATLHDNC